MGEGNIYIILYCKIDNNVKTVKTEPILEI